MELYNWYAYVKDKTALNTLPKALLRVTSFKVGEDLLTTHNSTINVLNVPSDVNLGDIVCLYNPQGIVRYMGLIKAIKENEIQLSQMQSFYKGQYLIDIQSSSIGVGDNKAWIWQVTTNLGIQYPKPSDFQGISLYDVEILDEWLDVRVIDDSVSNYSAMCTTYFYSNTEQDVELNIETKDTGTVTLNGQYLGECPDTEWVSSDVHINQGWNELIVCYTRASNNGGWIANITQGSSYVPIHQYFAKQTSNGTAIIEEGFARMLEKYAYGYSKNSSYQDVLMYQEKAPLKIFADSQTEGRLLTSKDNETIDMEKYIYNLYESYGVLLEFNIPYESWNIGDNQGGSVTVKKPNYTPLKISDNASCVVNIEPTSEIEKTNKLIVYSKEGVYRSTFYATINGIVEEGTSIIGRVGEIETKIVFSDDELTDIVKANLSEEMFNHKITFTILLDNKLYKFDDFKLGTPLEIYKGTQMYQSIITGYEISKNENENVISATITCGNARTSLTKILTRKLGIV